MKENDKKSVSIGKKARRMTSDLLCSFFDGVVDAATAFTDHKPYRISEEQYYKIKNCERSDIRHQITNLKRKKLISKVTKNKEHYFEITSKGRDVFCWSMIGKTKQTQKWDKCFRIVMFDVPEDKKSTREVIRHKLGDIGFIQMQKSVFVYPFDCKNEIDALCYYLCCSSYLKYLVVKITEGEDDLIREFLSRNILTLKDLE